MPARRKTSWIVAWWPTPRRSPPLPRRENPGRLRSYWNSHATPTPSSSPLSKPPKLRLSIIARRSQETGVRSQERSLSRSSPSSNPLPALSSNSCCLVSKTSSPSAPAREASGNRPSLPISPSPSPASAIVWDFSTPISSVLRYPRCLMSKTNAPTLSRKTVATSSVPSRNTA